MVSDRDRRQLEAVKAIGRRWAADPVQLRLVLAVAGLLIGVLAIERPLGSRLAAARTAHADALKQAHLAEDQRFLATQAAGYEQRVAVSSDLVDWQNYVLEKLRTTSATLLALEPKSSTSKPPFDVIEMEVVCKGSDYAAFVDLIDRLEHGERLVRVEKLRIERQQSSVYVTMIVKGLVRAGGTAPPAKGGKKAKPAAAADADATAAPPADAAPDEAATPDEAAADAPADAADAGEDGDG